MIGKIRLSVWIVGLVLAGYAVAMAEEMTTEGMEQRDEKLKFTVNLMGSYTDNRDSSANAESTFSFYFQPKLDATAKWADDSSVAFYYAPTYRYQTDASVYQNDSQLLHTLGLDLQQGMAEVVKLRLRDYFDYTDDPSVQQGGETLRSDASFILNRAEVGAVYAFNPRANIDVNARNMIKRYSQDEVAKDSDEDSVAGGATLWAQVSKKVGLLAQIDMIQYDYESSLGLQRGFGSIAGGVGLHGEFSPNFKADVRAGLQTAEYEDPSLSSDNTPYGSLSFLALPIPATRIMGGVSYSFQSSAVYPFASQKSTSFTGGLDWDAIPSQLTLALIGTYQLGEYSSDALPSSSEGVYSTGNRDAFFGTAEAIFKIDSVTSVKLSQSYEDVSSEVSEGFTKNTTTLTFSRVF